MKSENAVSEVLGLVTILAVMLIVISTIMIVGVPMIEDTKTRAQMDLAMNEMLSFQNDIEEVVRGPIWVQNPAVVTNIKGTGASRTTSFELVRGTLSVLSNSTNVSCIPSSCDPMNPVFSNNFTIIIPDSRIEYTQNREKIVYENGAVIRKYETGAPLMVSKPLMNIYSTGNGNITVSIHIIGLNATNSSSGGVGIATAETRLRQYRQVAEPESTPNANQTRLLIYTAYPEVWRKFFDEKLSNAGLGATGYYISGTNPLVVGINGTRSDATRDIFVSVYESRIEVQIK